MAILNIRNLADDVHRRLRARAAANGRSMEAEAREILAKACAPHEPATAEELQAIVDGLYVAGKPRSAVDDLIRERRREARRE